MIKINGKQIATDIQTELQNEVIQLKQKGIMPCLAVILVGEDQASQVYVRNKEKACEMVGIISRTICLPEETSEESLLALIQALNEDSTVHGILVQLPLPKAIDTQRIIAEIAPEKDVDGFHPLNIGALYAGLDTFLPCTPAGIIELLKRSHIPISGKHCVVLGRSNIVGKPIGALLLQENGTVTTCHSKTVDLINHLKQADIVIAAIGQANFVKGDWLKEGAVVIDVGINRNETGKLCGDVDMASCEGVVSHITPVPGGVGPMTIAMLMQNCIKAARKA